MNGTDFHNFSVYCENLLNGLHALNSCFRLSDGQLLARGSELIQLWNEWQKADINGFPQWIVDRLGLEVRP